MSPKHWNVFFTLVMYHLEEKEQYKGWSRSRKMCGVKYTRMNTMRRKVWIQLGWTFVGMPEQRTMAAKYGSYREHRGLSPHETYKEFLKSCPVPAGNITLVWKQQQESNIGDWYQAMKRCSTELKLFHSCWPKTTLSAPWPRYWKQSWYDAQGIQVGSTDR